MQKKGLVHIYTGEGKGKTTAAAGLAVRALAHGFKVGWISFHKNFTGEVKILKRLGVLVRGFAKYHPLCESGLPPKNRRQLQAECRKGIKEIYRLFACDKFDLLIFDEINICVRDGYLSQDDISALIRAKPKGLELVLTGRAASAKTKKIADLVSIIKQAKHPYAKGAQARKGIEY